MARKKPSLIRYVGRLSAVDVDLSGGHITIDAINEQTGRRIGDGSHMEFYCSQSWFVHIHPERLNMRVEVTAAVRPGSCPKLRSITYIFPN
jgi:hypothetical protein